jgi:3-oxoadipate enol-lactonase
MSFIKVNGVTIHYKYLEPAITASNNRCFIFINSLGTDFRIWEEVATDLRKFGSILLFDNRGHGLSEVIANTNSVHDFAEDLLALMDALTLKNCILIGLSVGGMIAQVVANRRPHLISKLVLCDTRHKIGNAQIWNERIEAAKEGGIAAISEGVMQRWFSERFRKEEVIKVSGYKKMLEHTSVLGYIQTCKAIRDADLTEIASKIKIPTLCIVGSEDKSTPPVEVKHLCELIEGAEYIVIEGSGHIPCVDNSKMLSQVIIDFINK